MLILKNNLVNEKEQIIRWPKKKTDKEFVIKFLSSKFKIKSSYSEKEVNGIINKHHIFNDLTLLRRELISRKYLDRFDDGSKYWKLS